MPPYQELSYINLICYCLLTKKYRDAAAHPFGWAVLMSSRQNDSDMEYINESCI